MGSVALLWKFDSAPPVTWTSSAVKSLTGSLSVKVTLVLWPEASVLAALVTTTVGGTVSMVKGVMGVVLVTPPVVTFSCGV